MAFSLALHELAQRLLILVLEFLGIELHCFALKNMRRQRNHISADAWRRYMRELLFLAPHLIIVAQRRAEQSLTERLQHDDVLAMCHDDAR